jgi:hypothetical protein
MTMPTLCPACLTVLPGDYPFDHVAIDRALAGEARLFTAMTTAERKETLQVGISRGMTLDQMAKRLHRSGAELRQVVGIVPPSPRVAAKEQLDRLVADLWKQELSDGDIALRTGRHTGSITKVRRRLQLPALYGPGGRRKRVAVSQ